MCAREKKTKEIHIRIECRSAMGQVVCGIQHYKQELQATKFSTAVLTDINQSIKVLTKHAYARAQG